MEALQQGNIRLAASLLLVREGARGPEVFMMKRPGGVDFPDLHVFPGGKLDAHDLLPDRLDGIADVAAMLVAMADGSRPQPLTAALRRQGMYSLR